MRTDEWEQLANKDYKLYIMQYGEFMNCMSNRKCCENCPENKGIDKGLGNLLPCGQFNCWVDLHSYYLEKNR